VQVLGKHRLGLADVEPDILGRAYEYLLRKFAEGGGASAREFYTPREVAILMARILAARPDRLVHRP
jgi:type I restriction enzyme M protein